MSKNEQLPPRRDNFFFLGSIPTADSPIGGIFPDTDRRLSPDALNMVTWYTHEPLKGEVRRWQQALYKICSVNSFREIREIFRDQTKKKELYDRFREAMAQRHRIRLKDKQSSRTNYGITLNGTRGGEHVSMTVKEFDDLINKSLQSANQVVDYFENQQTGILSPISDKMPRHVNEPPGWNNPVDLLLCMFSPKWIPQARFEARRRLVFADIAMEVLLYQKKVLPKKEELLGIFDHHLFNPQRHGSVKSLDFISYHNPQNFAVDGIHILREGDQYKPSPYILHHVLSLREWRDKAGTHYTQIEDEPKGIPQYILKMIRNNTYDPVKIRDAYRMAATFLERREIEPFLQAIVQAGKKAGHPLGYSIEENTLDGGKYLSMTKGKSHLHPGSSSQYQVMRVKLWYKNDPKATYELSCYTPEAYANYTARHDVNIAEYLINRQLLRRRYDGSVLNYTHPTDIYGINFLDQRDVLISGIRAQVREKTLIPNKWQNLRPRKFYKDEENEAVTIIAHQIDLYNKDKKSKFIPEVVIAIEKNTASAATALADHFSSQQLIYRKSEDIAIFIRNEKKRLKGKRILILDDIGDEGKTITQFRNALSTAGVKELRTAVLAMKKESKLDKEGNIDFAGIAVSTNEYVIFYPERIERVNPYQGSFAIITRRNKGKTEVLLQLEKDGKYNLPGGVVDLESEESALEALRREINEELGHYFMLEIMKTLQNVNPIRTEVSLSKKQGKSPHNTLYLNGYSIDGSEINVKEFRIPKKGDVIEVRWFPIENAIDILGREGFKKLLREYLKASSKGFSLYSHEYAEKYQQTIESLYSQSKYDLLLESMGGLPKNCTILDIGSDIGAIHPKGIAQRLKKLGFGYLAMDVNLHFFNDHKPHEGIVASGEALPFSQKSFRAILALDVLDHIEDTTRTISESRRILTRDGKAFFIIPTMYKLDCFKEDLDFEYINKKRRSSHVNTISADHWIQRIKKTGYEIESTNGFGFALSMPFLFWADDQFVPQRKDYLPPTEGIHKDILSLLQQSLTPADIRDMDNSLKTVVKFGGKNLKDLVKFYYKSAKEDLWPLWSIPLLIRMHPKYQYRKELQNLEHRLRKLVTINASKFSPAGKRRLRKIGKYLTDSNFLLRSGGNSLLIVATKVKENKNLSRKQVIYESSASRVGKK